MHATIFLSHGAPSLILEPSPAREFLSGLGRRIDRPKAILAVSAHWETQRPAVNAVSANETIHDFHGFPSALYALRYPAPGSAVLAARVADLLEKAGFAPETDHARGLDHGAWIPLKLVYPEADIPVVQLSVQSRLGPDHHFAVGRALAPLRREDILIVGSGSFTHNLGELDWAGSGAPAPDWTADFIAWMDAALVEGRTDDLLAYRQRAPHAARNHPSEEHLLPLYVAWGAAGAGRRTERLHASMTFGTLSMAAYAFSEKRISAGY